MASECTALELFTVIVRLELYVRVIAKPLDHGLYYIPY